MELISAVRRCPNYIPAFTTSILDSKPAALTAANNHHNTQVSVYCDGSSLDNGTGGAAVLFINRVENVSLCYHLGPSNKHTVYEGELIGLFLAIHLLTSLQFQFNTYTVIGTDNQAAIQALNNQRPHPGHYILDHIHDAVERLHRKQASLRNPGHTNLPIRDVIDLRIHWTPGHEKFPPNERADELAKQAAQGDSSPKRLLPSLLRTNPLPDSIPAIHQANLTLLRKNWKKRWKKSLRFPLINSIDVSLPSNNFLKLINSLDRCQSALIAQLRTGHSQLNQHLFRIRRSETPSCPHCNGITVESVKHYLTQCPHYQHERHHLRRKLRRQADSISFLLSNPAATKPLLAYIKSTKRFQPQTQQV